MINTETQIDLAKAESFKGTFEALRSEIHKVVIGQDSTIENLLISLFSRGHCVLVGVPGLAKTLLVKSLAGALGLDFSRIQFTPDLMPSDITGTDILDEDLETGRKRFTFVKGPLFANVILADEINRTPPKTQAAMLEAMQEHHVTAGGTTYQLGDPFFVMATQNPIEQEGTYPLPEAQLDRFMFQLELGYPSFEEEMEVIRRTTTGESASVQPVIGRQEILDIQMLVRHVPIPENLLEHATRLVQSTRPGSPQSPDFVNAYVRWGAGPRATQYLVLGAKTRALSRGRFNVELEDLKAIAHPVLRHRMVLTYTAEADKVTLDNVIDRLLEKM